jgi:hypothetical protein
LPLLLHIGGEYEAFRDVGDVFTIPATWTDDEVNQSRATKKITKVNTTPWEACSFIRTFRINLEIGFLFFGTAYFYPSAKNPFASRPLEKENTT